jgi:hypothetical protein
MSDLSWRSSRRGSASRMAPGTIAGHQQRGLRALAAVLLSSLCVMSCMVATAHADPPPPVDGPPPPTEPAPAPSDFTVGGWKFDNHWTSDEVLANKAMTSTIANIPAIATLGCSALGAIPRVGFALALFCRVHLVLARRAARDAQAHGRCFRWVIPLHQIALTYPSSYTGGWCR